MFALQLRPNSVFSVYPQDGEIPPESDLEITVTAHLNDCVRYMSTVMYCAVLERSVVADNCALLFTMAEWTECLSVEWYKRGFKQCVKRINVFEQIQ